jgi:acetyl-CoA synthetase
VAFVVLKSGRIKCASSADTLLQHIRTKIGPLAAPDHIHAVSALPKTRSGKILRRILRQIACGNYHELGDLSTLADTSVIAQLIMDIK